jgi:hypothetical protein
MALTQAEINQINKFSDEFDVLLRNYAHQAPFGVESSDYDLKLDEYEKSIYLTDAQEEVVLSLYNGQGVGSGFDSTEEVKRYLSNLIVSKEIQPSELDLPHIAANSQFFKLNPECWFVTYEAAVIASDDCVNGAEVAICPITQDEYHKIKKNPYRGANKRRVLSLTLADNVIELIAKEGYSVSRYHVKYLKRPEPIVLVNLPEGLTVGYGEGKSEQTPCKLHEALHNKILERAVILALQNKGQIKNINER